MPTFGGWTERHIRDRERVFDGLIAKATRALSRSVTLDLRGALTAAVELSPEPEYVPGGWQPAGGQVAASWLQHVDGQLMPYVETAFLDSAAATHGALEVAAATSVPKVTDELAGDYLAAARNRLVGVGDLVWNSIRVQLSDGYAAGDGVDQLAARIRDVVDVTGPRARTIARTELVSAVNASSLLQVKIAGFTDAECSKCWQATEDERTRLWHAQADGQCVGLSQPFIVGAEGLQFPGDPSGRPDNVINCRCTLGYEFHDEPSIASTYGLDWDPAEHPRDPLDGRFVDVGDVVGRFFDAEDVDRMSAEMTHDHPWTSRQRAALEGYVTRTFTPVNGMLRGEYPHDAKTAEDVADIHGAMRPTTRPIHVSRRVNPRAFDILPGSGPEQDYSEQLQHLVGRTLRDRGFLSTSTSERWAHPTIAPGRLIVMELDVPVGTPAAVLGTEGGPGLPHENELLLDYGTRFTITRVVKEPNGPTRVYGRVLAHEPAVASFGDKVKQWIEALHPRGDAGRFVNKGGSITYVAKKFVPNLKWRPATPDPNAPDFHIVPPRARGASGDGYYASGMWGRFGAAGVMVRAHDSAGNPRFLIVRRQGGKGHGKWQLPGGAIDQFETPEQGAARETFEELGVGPDRIAQFKRLGVHRVSQRVPGKTPWTYHNITADAPSTFDVRNYDRHELSGAAWVTREQLDAMRKRGLLVHPFAQSLDGVLAAFGDAPATAGFDPKELRDPHGRWTETPGGAVKAAFHYLDVEDPHALKDFEHEMDAAGDPVSSEQLDELKHYADDGYDDLNGALRAEATGGEALTPEQKARRELISTVMRPLPQNVRVRRTVWPDAFGLQHTADSLYTSHYDWTHQLEPFVGKTLTEPGFLSTSLSERWGGSAEYGILIEFNVPEGTPAYFMGGPDGPGLEDEHELLLDAGTRFKVRHVTHSPGGLTTVHAEVVS